MRRYATDCTISPCVPARFSRSFLIKIIMKQRFSLPVTLLAIAICCSLLHAAEVLTQQDVIKLLELKIPEQTIIDKVKDSGTAFVLGTEDMARLKKAGASDEVIAAMQATAASAAASGG